MVCTDTGRPKITGNVRPTPTRVRDTSRTGTEVSVEGGSSPGPGWGRRSLVPTGDVPSDGDWTQKHRGLLWVTSGGRVGRDAGGRRQSLATLDLAPHPAVGVQSRGPRRGRPSVGPCTGVGWSGSPVVGSRSPDSVGVVRTRWSTPGGRTRHNGPRSQRGRRVLRETNGQCPLSWMTVDPPGVSVGPTFLPTRFPRVSHRSSVSWTVPSESLGVSGPGRGTSGSTMRQCPRPDRTERRGPRSVGFLPVPQTPRPLHPFRRGRDIEGALLGHLRGWLAGGQLFSVTSVSVVWGARVVDGTQRSQTLTGGPSPGVVTPLGLRPFDTGATGRRGDDVLPADGAW